MIRSIPDIQVTDQATRDALEAMKEIIEVMLGRRGSDLDDKVLTHGDSSSIVALFEALNTGLSHDTLADVSADDHHSESHTVASHNDTSAAGSELDTLTDGSDTTLHIHDLAYPERVEWDQNGFENRTDSTITWTDSGPNYTLSVQPTGVDFDYWIAGVKYTTDGDTVQIDNTKEGIHAIYYDGSTLTALANPTSANIDSLIRTKALVSIVYWDTSAVSAIYVGDERHGKGMSPATHAYLHFTEGLKYISGLGLNTMDVDGDGDDNSAAQFGVSSGAASDEDIYHTISAVASGTGLPIYYMLGADADWQKHTNAGYSVRTYDDTDATRLARNEYTGGAWQLTEVGNLAFVLCHIFATTEKDNPMVSIMGQNTYTTANQARTGALTEIRSLILDDVLFPEIKPIATVIFQTSDGYDNDVKGRVRSTDDGDDYIDWRSETISRVELSTSDHNALSGLQGGAANDYYHLTGAEAGTLTDNSIANALHRHSELVASDGNPDPALSVDAAGATTIGQAASGSPQLIVKGGASGTDIIQLQRTSGVTTTYGWSLAGGGLTFKDVVLSKTVANLMGTNSLNQLYLGQRSKSVQETSNSLLSPTTHAVSAGADVNGTWLKIQGGLGNGAGIPGDILFNTGNIGASGTTAHTSTTRLTIENDSGKLTFPIGTGINEFSTDGTLAGDSDDAVPTEKAVKTYVDAAGGGGAAFNVAAVLGTL